MTVAVVSSAENTLDRLAGGVAAEQRGAGVAEDRTARRWRPPSGADRTAPRRTAAGRTSRAAGSSRRRRRPTTSAISSDVGGGPGEEERLAPARAHDRGDGQARQHVAAEHRDAEQHEDRGAVRPLPGGDGVAGHHQGDDVRQPCAVADGSLPELQERFVGLWGGPPARHLEEHRQFRPQLSADAPGYGAGDARARRLGGPLRRLRGHARGRRGRQAATSRATSRATCWRRSRSSPTATSTSRDEFATRAYAEFHPAPLRPEGTVVLGRAARAAGLRLRAADRARLRASAGRRASSCSWPRSRRSGSRSAALLARRIVPEPWASAAALLVGLSPPALAHATTVYPDLMAGTMLAGAVLAALRVRERPDLGERGGGRDAARAAAVAGAEVPAAGRAGGVRARALDGATRAAHGGARGRRDHGRLARRLRDDQRPPLRRARCRRRWRRPATRRPARSSAGDYLERIPRLAALWIDRDVGLLRWAPVLRAQRRSRPGCCGARAAPTSRAWSAERGDAEVAAELSLLVCAGVSSSRCSPRRRWAASGSRRATSMAAFPVAAALAAWGLRHAPRTGAVLGALTLLCSAWLVLALAFGDADGWVHPAWTRRTGRGSRRCRGSRIR